MAGGDTRTKRNTARNTTLTEQSDLGLLEGC